MTLPALPAQGSTDWYPWAQAVQDTLVADESRTARFLGRWNPRNVPGVAGLPQLMASPPTLSAHRTSGTTPIANPVDVPAIVNALPNTAAFGFRGGPSEQRGATYPDNLVAYPKALSNEGANWTYVEFIYYGTSFEYGYKGQGYLGTQVLVDGQLAEANPYTADVTQDGGFHYRRVTFSSARWARIRIDVYAPFAGLIVGPTDVVLPTPNPVEKLLVIHDSYGEGIGATAYGYAPQVGWMLGFEEMISLSQGGTGLLAVNSGLSRPKYRDRSGDWAQINPTSVLIGMSVNDAGFTASALATELALLLPIVKAIPSVRDVWVMGRPALSTSTTNTIRSEEPTVAAAATAAGVPYISLVNPTSLWSGSGRQGATTGSGSADVLVYTDGGHPSQAGHDGIARVFTQRLLSVLGEV